jgi:hypothetical protein
MKFVYDFDTLSKRHKAAVAIGSVVSGCLFALFSDVYIMGYSFERALVNLNILIAVSIIFMGVLMVIRAVRKPKS